MGGGSPTSTHRVTREGPQRQYRPAALGHRCQAARRRRAHPLGSVRADEGADDGAIILFFSGLSL